LTGDGAAPEGESRAIASIDAATGIITVTAFSAVVATDEILQIVSEEQASIGSVESAASAGDPTSVDLLMAMQKQLINTMEGTVGLPAYPGTNVGAAPANDVSIAEVVARNHWIATRDSVLILANTTALTTIDTNVDDIETAVDALTISDGIDWNHLSVTTGLQSVDSTWSSVATHEVFSITGDIEFEITVACDVTVTGADSLFIGFAGTYFTRIEKIHADISEILSINTAPVANVAWIGQIVDPVVSIAPTNETSLVQSQYRGISLGGIDFGYEIQTASMPAGQFTFNIKWRSITTGTPATVSAGLGGTL